MGHGSIIFVVHLDKIMCISTEQNAMVPFERSTELFLDDMTCYSYKIIVMKNR